jgi:hypothetical protein
MRVLYPGHQVYPTIQVELLYLASDPLFHFSLSNDHPMQLGQVPDQPESRSDQG